MTRSLTPSPFENFRQVMLGPLAPPSPHDCARAIWGADAEYQASPNPPAETGNAWRSLYLLNVRTGEMLDVAPLSDDAKPTHYRVSSKNSNQIGALAQFLAERTGGSTTG